MPGITMCPGTNCSVRNQCYRHIAKPNDQQSWVDFPGTDETCEDFWPVEKDLENRQGGE